MKFDIDIEVESALGIVAASFLKRELRYSKSPFKKIQRIKRSVLERLQSQQGTTKKNYLFVTNSFDRRNLSNDIGRNQQNQKTNRNRKYI